MTPQTRLEFLGVKTRVYSLVIFICLSFIGDFGFAQTQEDARPESAEAASKAEEDLLKFIIRVEDGPVFLLEQQAEGFLEDLKRQVDERTHSKFKKHIRAALGRIKRNWHMVQGFKKFLINYGPVVSVTVALSEIFSYGVILPVATYLKRPDIAFWWGALPTVAVIATPIAFGYTLIRKKKRIRKELGLKSLRALHQLRRELLGFELRHHVISAIAQKTEVGSFQFEVLKRPPLWRILPGAAKPHDGSAFYPDELVTLIRAYGGAQAQRDLQEAIDSTPRRDERIARLLMIIWADPDCFKGMIDVLVNRTQKAWKGTREQIMRIRELELAVAISKDQMKKVRWKAIKLAARLRSKEHGLLAARLFQLNGAYTALLGEIRRAEYHILYRRYIEAHPVENPVPVAGATHLIERIRRSLRAINAAVRAIPDLEAGDFRYQIREWRVGLNIDDLKRKARAVTLPIFTCRGAFAL